MTSVTLEQNGLRTPWGAYFNYAWLRDNCPTSFDAQTRERIYDIFHETALPVAERAHLDGETLVIIWRGSAHVTRHSVALLQAYSQGQPRRDPADLQRRFWYADHYDNMATFVHGALLADACLVADWMETLLVQGVAIVTGMPDSDAGLTALARVAGHVRPTFFGEYFDVRTHIAPTNLAYTAKALELHTDTPAEDMAPGIQFLHCRANSVAGGDNLFLDGAAAAEDFRAVHPEDFVLLAETEIPYYCEHDGYDMRARQRVIELDRRGAVSGVAISQHMADYFDMPQESLDRYYPAFIRFGRWLQSDKYVMRFRLAAGECIVFDNHRILHGRDAYTADSGNRYLRGCYTDRGELRSRYRALTAAGRFA
jgi:gamma-butyrobetaine dioxygenase